MTSLIVVSIRDSAIIVRFELGNTKDMLREYDRMKRFLGVVQVYIFHWTGPSVLILKLVPNRSFSDIENMGYGGYFGK